MSFISVDSRYLMIASGNFTLFRNWGTTKDGRYSFNFLYELQRQRYLPEDLEQLFGKDWLVDVHDKVGNQTVNETELLLAHVFEPIQECFVVFLCLNTEEGVVELIYLRFHLLLLLSIK
jgi:hypothetical protein